MEEAMRLIEIKAPVDWRNPDIDHAGDTVLVVASKQGNTDMARLLIESKAAVDKANGMGETPLMTAAYNNHMAIVRALVESGADTTIRGDENKTAAESAKRKGNHTIAEYLTTEAPRVQAQMRVERDGKTLNETKRNALLSKRPSSLRLSELGDYLTLRAEELGLAEHKIIITSLVEAEYDGEILLEATDSELLDDACGGKRARLKRLKKAIAKLKSWDLEPSGDYKQPSIGFSLPLGDIKVGDRVGSGGFGDVFLVDVKGISQKCVIKVPKEVNRADMEKEYTNCIKIGGQRNLLRFIGLAAYKNRQCFVTEFCARGSLDKLHDKEDLISRFFHIATGLCLAVAHLHSFPKPIIHRDIACRNVLVKADWTVVLCDYGLARETGNNDYYIASKGTLLPLLFMSPEALKGTFKPAGDVWQIGVTMWEVLTKGWKPYFSHSGRIARDELLSAAKGIRKGKLELKYPQGTDAKAAAFVRACCTRDYKARTSAVQLLLDHIPDGKGRQAIREHGSAQTKEKALKAGLDLGVPNYGGVLAAPEESLEVDASGEVNLSGEPVLDALNKDEDKDIDN